MNTLRRPLLWEVIRYEPHTFFILEAVSSNLKQNLQADMSHIHYFLEEVYSEHDLRGDDYSTCKNTLRDRVMIPDFVVRFYPGDRVYSMYSISQRTCTRIFLPTSIMIKKKQLPGWVWLTSTSGFLTSLGQEYNQCYIFRPLPFAWWQSEGGTKKVRPKTARSATLPSNFVQKANSIYSHSGACPIVVKQHVYVFGGNNTYDIREGSRKAERYHLAGDFWEKLISLPYPSEKTYTTAIKENIYIAGSEFNFIYKYDPNEGVYVQLALRYSYDSINGLLSYNNRLILLQAVGYFVTIDPDDSGEVLERIRAFHYLDRHVPTLIHGTFQNNLAYFQSSIRCDDDVCKVNLEYQSATKIKPIGYKQK